MSPEDLKYTSEHEWVRVTDEGTLRFGITDFAQNALGDVVYVSLPNAGSQVTAGQPCGEVESTKSVSDVYAPLDGTVVAVNADLDGAPEQVNSDPYGAGWMVEIALADGVDVEQALAGLMDAAAYEGTLGDR